jgi:broad specificity phosphatase PhoE
MTELFFIRHGESECNTHQLLCTMGADPDLTDEGINQAHQAGKSLKDNNINFDFMVISNLTRTNYTANIINQHLNIDKIYYDNDVRERGTLYFGIKYFNKAGLLKNDYDGFIAADEDYDAMFVPRIAKVLCKYLTMPQPSGLIVAHGNAGKAASNYFLEKTISLNNCEVFTLDPQKISNFAEKCGEIQNGEFVDEL